MHLDIDSCEELLEENALVKAVEEKIGKLG